MILTHLNLTEDTEIKIFLEHKYYITGYRLFQLVIWYVHIGSNYYFLNYLIVKLAIKILYIYYLQPFSFLGRNIDLNFSLKVGIIKQIEKIFVT